MMTEISTGAGRTLDILPHPTATEAEAEAEVAHLEADLDLLAAPQEVEEAEETHPLIADNPYRTVVPTITIADRLVTTTTVATMAGQTTTLTALEARKMTNEGETVLHATKEDPAIDRTTCPVRNRP